MIFDAISLGNIEQLKAEQAHLGFKQPDDVSFLVDEANSSQNALFVSCAIKEGAKALEMTKYLIEEAKCDVNLEDTLKQTCLFYVSRDGRADLVKLLLHHGAKANHSDSYGQTPLFYAAREGHCHIMQALIEAGGDPDFIDNEGQTPVFYAVRMGKVQSMDYLIENCEIDIQREDNFGNNLINVA